MNRSTPDSTTVDVDTMRFCHISDIEPIKGELREIRRHFHQNPELSFEETMTSSLVASSLQEWGYEVTSGVGKTGVVGRMRVNNGLRSIGLRADMDALPITEVTGLPYASTQPGKMHACGHDGHTAMLLGAARYLASTRRFNGTLNLYFQPAEELGPAGGARAMMADGLFERFPCDAVFGMHNHPGIDQGKFLLRRGAFMAAADTVIITVHGIGGHAARPHLAVDPVVVAASLIMSLQTIVSRNVDPGEPAVVTVGALQSGTAANVISGTAVMKLSVRSFSKSTRDRLRSRIRELAEHQAASYGASVTVEYQEGCPALVNHEHETRFAASVARELVGESQVEEEADRVMASEDFALMLQARPGCYLRLGNGLGTGVGEGGCMVHHPMYDFNDRNLTVGAAFWARLVERYLND